MRFVRDLNGLSFKAKDGTVTALLGRNGAGKTTTLRIRYTIMRPDTAVALIDGFDTIRDRTEVQNRVGALADTRGFYPHLTARKHIDYYDRLHGLDGAAIAKRVEELIETLDMIEFANRRDQEYSKGQALKVALAHALVHRPKNLLLDAPTSGLHIAGKRAVRQLIRDVRDDGGCVLFCSHSMREVEALADQIIVIANARIAESGVHSRGALRPALAHPPANAEGSGARYETQMR